jgi:hypothetical protein
MSDPPILQPAYWRERAKETRDAAKDISHPANRKILEDVAQSYEEMADLVEKRDRPRARPRRTAVTSVRTTDNQFSIRSR